MKAQLARAVAVALLAMFFAQSTFATCGGGGGGGGGGVSGSSSGPSAPVYVVPWKVGKATDAPAAGLVLYWFPASEAEVKNSSLRQSRILSLYAAQCVSMEVSDGVSTPHADKLIGQSTRPIAALAKPDGTLVGKVENTGGKLKVADVEKLVDGEMKERESGISAQMKEAAGKATAGDKDGAIAMYKAVLEQKCLFP
ncbi:MAG TPA: hypothetical protein VGW32_10345, partial [Pyrinomonadaceae bacterium]|nr:hypothetical protein [Pyrinomonadaceae bacterium]